MRVDTGVLGLREEAGVSTSGSEGGRLGPGSPGLREGAKIWNLGPKEGFWDPDSGERKEGLAQDSETLKFQIQSVGPAESSLAVRPVARSLTSASCWPSEEAHVGVRKRAHSLASSVSSR